MSDSSERYYAEMEAARNQSEDAYFDARPELMKTVQLATLFRAGFERAFHLHWIAMSNLPAQYTCERHRGEVRKGGACCWCQLEEARTDTERANG